MKQLIYVMTLSLLFSCAEKSKIKPIFQATKLAQSHGDGKYTIVRLKVPLSENSIDPYESSIDPRNIRVPIAGDFLNLFTAGFMNLGAGLGLGRTLITLHQPVPDLDSPILKSIVVKRIFFHIDKQEPLEYTEFKRGVIKYWRKLREFIHVDNTSDFSFIGELKVRLSSYQSSKPFSSYAPEAPEIEEMMSKKDFSVWDQDLKNKKELVSYRRSDKSSLNKPRLRYVVYTDKPVAVKNLLTREVVFKELIKEVVVINKSVMIELAPGEIIEEKLYLALDSIEDVFTRYSVSKINRCNEDTCLDFSIEEENLLNIVKNKNMLKVETFVDARRLPPASFQLKGFLEFEVKLDLPL